MKKFFNWILILAACVGSVYLIGLIVPRNQSATSKTNIGPKPDEIYAVLVDFAHWPAWNPDFAVVKERPSNGEHPLWQVTDKSGRTFELEVVALEEDKSCKCAYTVDETRHTLTFDLSWYGQGGRICLSRSADTRSPWLRAKRFLLPASESSALQLLNALCVQLGEPARVEEH